MKRRQFIQQGTVLGSSAIVGSNLNTFAKHESSQAFEFQLKYAPHLGMFKHHVGDDPVDQLNFMADMGFTAFEDNGMKKREIATQEAMAKTMADRGLDMGVFVAHEIYWKEPNLANGDESLRQKFLDDIRSSVDVAKRVNATWMTVVPGHVDLKKNMGFQTAHVMETLKRASDILEPHGLVMVLEPLNFYNHPGMFLTEVPQSYALCKGVDSPACKILFDIYHQQITEGNIIPNIDAAWDEVAYFQIGDNPGRKEPTTGEINYKNIFKHIHSKGFDGILGMEHGIFNPGKEGEEALIAAYKSVDMF
ncbi:MAG: TIM barrel protein [Saprospiraceae bacterium]|nr:TIM barrel protein [Saprospiraceae bacterium]